MPFPDPQIAPSPPAKFSATIEELKTYPNDFAGSMIVVVSDWKGLAEDGPREIYHALKRNAKLEVGPPRKNSMELVIPKKAMQGLKVRDRISIGGYTVLGHSESNHWYLGEWIEVKKL